MEEQIATILLLTFGAYASLGLVFGIAFVAAGVDTVDHAAAGSPWSFRLLILPGVAALWPLLLRKWITAAKGEHP